MHAYIVQCAKSNRTGLPFQQMKTLKHWIIQQVHRCSVTISTPLKKDTGGFESIGRLYFRVYWINVLPLRFKFVFCS